MKSTTKQSIRPPDGRDVLLDQGSEGKRYLFFAIVALGIALRLWHINWGLPNIYDEAVPLRISWKFWNWGGAGLDFNPHFFVYPAFTFYLQFALQSVHYFVGHLFGTYGSLASFQDAYISDPTTFVISARLVTIAFDVGTVIVVYLLALRYGDRRVALLAAVFIALNPLHITESHLINVDTPLTFFLVLSLLFLTRLYREPVLKWYVLTGISMGLATATKYNGGLLILVFLIVHLLKSKSIKHAFNSLRSTPFVAALALCALVFALFNPYIILRFDDFVKDFSNVGYHMEAGHLGLDPNTSTSEFYFLQSLPRIIGWPMLIAAVMSVGHLFVSRKRVNFILLAFPILYLGTISMWAMRADRYIFPVVPFFILFGSMGITRLWDETIRYLGKHKLGGMSESRPFGVDIILIVGCILLFTPVSEVLSYHRRISKPDTRTITKKWIEEHFSLGSAIATGPFGVELPETRYLTLLIPFDAVNPETIIPFYNPQWYEDLDLLITSDYDYGRYSQEPQKFHDILQFYDSLRSRWNLAYKIEPGDTATGPAFWLYRPPVSSRKVFAFEGMENSSSIDSSKVVNFVGKLALILYAKGKLEKGEQLFHVVVLMDPKNPYAYKNLASIEYALDENNEALATIQSYMRLNPPDPRLLRWKGGGAPQTWPVR